MLCPAEIEIFYQQLDLIQVRYRKLVNPDSDLYSFSVLAEFECRKEAEIFAKKTADDRCIPVTKFKSYLYNCQLENLAKNHE